MRTKHSTQGERRRRQGGSPTPLGGLGGATEVHGLRRHESDTAMAVVDCARPFDRKR